MIIRGRKESDELMALRYLNTRMELTEKERFYYSNLEKGYEGEVKFDQQVEDLQEERYIINDLLLEVNNSYFQIDSLLISQGIIHLFDIKNYQGDFYLESEKLYSLKTNREFKNPVNQLKRSETLFRQLLQNLKQNFLVEASVIYINPEFTLYQAPINQPFILPTQVNRFMKNINNTPSKLNDGHKQLAQQLISLHQTNNPFTKVPKYEYEDLRKGITCSKCTSFSISVVGKKCICKQCGHEELVDSAVMRSVTEFKLLFPTKRVTTNIIHDWCMVVKFKKRIGTILRKNLKIVGVRQWSYYE